MKILPGLKSCNEFKGNNFEAHLLWEYFDEIPNQNVLYQKYASAAKIVGVFDEYSDNHSI